MKNSKANRIYPGVFIFIYSALLLTALSLILKFGASPNDAVEKIGFITTGDVSDTGWSAINYLGVKAACEELGVELIPYFEIPEHDGSCLKAVDELASAGAGMIILNSSGYSEDMEKYLPDYSDIAFYGTSTDHVASNLTSYSSRLYQARYLSGIVAGMHTKAGKIGFVAADKTTEVYRGINAFTLGVRRVSPDAQVVVAWTGSLTDKEKEMELAEKLIREEGVDVLTYHQNQPHVIDMAERAGIASIGYYEPATNVSDNYLTCAMCDWAPLYKSLIQEYLRGQANTSKYDWLGLESNVIILTEFSPLVSDSARTEVEAAIQEILSGKDVFSGKIYDNLGNVRCGEGEAMSDDTLMYDMDWLAEGVCEYEN